MNNDEDCDGKETETAWIVEASICDYQIDEDGSEVPWSVERVVERSVDAFRGEPSPSSFSSWRLQQSPRSSATWWLLCDQYHRRQPAESPSWVPRSDSTGDAPPPLRPLATRTPPRRHPERALTLSFVDDEGYVSLRRPRRGHCQSREWILEELELAVRTSRHGSDYRVEYAPLPNEGLLAALLRHLRVDRDGQ